MSAGTIDLLADAVGLPRTLACGDSSNAEDRDAIEMSGCRPMFVLRFARTAT